MLLLNETDERFLVHINEILSSGGISDLFAPDELETIYSALRPLAKAAMIPNTPKSLLKFFINRVRDNLHVVLCFSPMGSVLRTNCNRFPALINCTQIDWFHAWPKEALVRVAKRHLNDVKVLEHVLRDQVAWAARAAAGIGVADILVTATNSGNSGSGGTKKSSETKGRSSRKSPPSSASSRMSAFKRSMSSELRRRTGHDTQSIAINALGSASTRKKSQRQKAQANNAEAVLRQRAEALRENLAFHMAEVHLSVKDMSEHFRAEYGRHNYCTPKSFLEFIK